MVTNYQPAKPAASKPENKSNLTYLFTDFNRRNNTTSNSTGSDEKNWFKCSLNPFLRDNKNGNESTVNVSCGKLVETHKSTTSCRTSNESEDYTIDMASRDNCQLSDPLRTNPLNTMKSCRSLTGMFQRRRKVVNEDEEFQSDSNPISPIDRSLASSPRTPLGTSPSKNYYPFHPKPTTAKVFDTQTIDLIQSTSFEEVLAFGFRKPTNSIAIPKTKARNNYTADYDRNYSQTIKLSLTPDKLKDFHSLAPSKEHIY